MAVFSEGNTMTVFSEGNAMAVFSEGMLWLCSVRECYGCVQ